MHWAIYTGQHINLTTTFLSLFKIQFKGQIFEPMFSLVWPINIDFSATKNCTQLCHRLTHYGLYMPFALVYSMFSCTTTVNPHCPVVSGVTHMLSTHSSKKMKLAYCRNCKQVQNAIGWNKRAAFLGFVHLLFASCRFVHSTHDSRVTVLLYVHSNGWQQCARSCRVHAQTRNGRGTWMKKESWEELTSEMN